MRRLVEYQQFKEVAGRLSDQERLWRQVFQREPEQSPPVREVLSEDVQVFDLLSALQEVLAQTAASPGFGIHAGYFDGPGPYQQRDRTPGGDTGFNLCRVV